jgi:hypothetical protein
MLTEDLRVMARAILLPTWRSYFLIYGPKIRPKRLCHAYHALGISRIGDGRRLRPQSTMFFW